MYDMIGVRSIKATESVNSNNENSMPKTVKIMTRVNTQIPKLMLKLNLLSIEQNTIYLLYYTCNTQHQFNQK